MAQTVKAATLLELGSEDEPFQIPVAVKKIRQTNEVSLDQASPDGHALKRIYLDCVTGEPVEHGEIRKGMFRAKPSSRDKATWGEFAEIDPEDLAVIEDATKLDTFRVEHFIPLSDVPFERVTDAYFLAPAEGMSAKPLVLLAKALKRTKRAGVFKFVKSTRQHLAVVYEKDGGLIVNTLAWSGESAAVREAALALDRQDAKVSGAEVALATDLVSALGADADVLDAFEDDLVPLRYDLIERALRGERLPKRARKERAAVADDGLEDLLRESLNKSAATRREGVPA